MGNRFIYTVKKNSGRLVIVDKEDNIIIRDMYRACDFLNRLEEEKENWKMSSCNSMNTMSVLSMDSQIVLEEIIKLEKEVGVSECEMLMEKFNIMMGHLRGEF